MAKGGRRGGKIQKMMNGGMAEELNPGKTVDVTEMANGGFMNDKMVNRMMGGGRPKGMAKGGAMGGVKRRAKGGAAGGLNSAIKRVKAGK